MAKGDFMRGVVYAPGETGWAEDLGDGTWRIANVPLSSGINIDDVVMLHKDENERHVVGSIVRRNYDKKTTIRYQPPFQDNFKLLKAAFLRSGWKFEGGRPGVGLLAHKGVTDPAAVALTVGLRIELKASM